ncbi:hypothetical protein Poly51_20950 [Rubripirellula tenax]|uniref:Uncharacterized protein n=1 Tax=Rubripirellula tenax TaxID=2528015 RepID=A0A5C6FF05_9BACT|nr:hypothetical protein [Rubripirellula tenax]TWU59307.1 hypothetical protein Poly51_20950 [Rubripirellula tenax]
MLNATAELTALGELVITGTDDAENVELSINNDGHLQLRDADNQIIAIANHPGSPTDPLDPSDVTSGRIEFYLGGGDDVLRIALPQQLSIDVFAGGGDDTTTVTGSAPGEHGYLFIASEKIFLDPIGDTLDLSGASVRLSGDVSVGEVGERTHIKLSSGYFESDGDFSIAGDVEITTTGQTDLSEAIVSGSAASSTLRITGTGSAVFLGTFDASAGHAVDDVQVDTVSSVQFVEAPLAIDGDLIVRNVANDVQVDSSIRADSVSILTGMDMQINGDIATLGGDVTLIAGGRLTTDADITIVDDSRLGSIALSSDQTTLSGTTLTTTGGRITVSGPVMIDGDVLVDSGNVQSADTAGEIEFLNTIESLDGLDDRLIIDARGERFDGSVTLLGTVGRTDRSPLANDLNALTINAAQIQTDSIGITGGNLTLSADSIVLLGDQYETRNTGEIRINGPLQLPRGDSRVVSAGDIDFGDAILGQPDTGTLTARAGGDLTFTGPIDRVTNVIAEAVDDIQFRGPVLISGDLTASGDTIHVASDITTTLDSTGGTVFLNSQTLLTIDGQISVGTGKIIGNGGGGRIDASLGSLKSDAADEAVTLANANRITLGDIELPNGRLTLGTDADVTGRIDQAVETTIKVDRLVSSNTDELILGNEGNDFVMIEDVVSGGNVAIVDSVGDVVVNSIRAAEQNIDVRTNGDLIVTSIDAGSQGDVVLQAGDDIRDSDVNDDSRIIADALSVRSENVVNDLVSGIQLSTNVNQIEGSVAGIHPGDFIINEVDSIDLASSDSLADEVMMTSNGQIIVRAGDAITVMDHTSGDDDANRTSDPELVAGGTENGRIELIAPTVTLSDDAQLDAAKLTRAFADPNTSFDETMPVASTESDAERAVLIRATSFVVGDGTQIFTGETQGTARVFAPRPIDTTNGAAGVTVTPDGPSSNPFAFYDPNTVRVNVLEQALVNDATGILTFSLGQSGERGLTVDIDWGAPTRRFQQINGLSGDEQTFVGVDRFGNLLQPVATDGTGRLTIEHFYAEKADIVNSDLNGRTSATEPLNVRFAVRHHESILVQAESVTQSGFSNSVAGEIVSSTDDPSTPGLDTGAVSFIIPNLTIPVAFFPVRDVIPEFETPTFFVRAETPMTLTTVSVETTESTSVSVVSREEFFQLRVLSPDPNGEDLIAPQKLPDDILDGDKIKQLFAELPDGTYIIEYVLGDGNQRTILKVDVREGEATIPEGELDEGELKLKLLHGYEDSSENKIDPNVAPSTQAAIESGEVDIDRTEVPWADPDRVESPSVTSGAGVAFATATLRWRTRRNNEANNRLSQSSRFMARQNQ